jgi:hypothetical protein
MSDRFYLEDSRRIQKETDLITSRTREIKRLLAAGVDARDLIDAAVRQAVETKTTLDKFKEYGRVDPVVRGGEYGRMAGALSVAVKDLEGVVGLYGGVSTSDSRAEAPAGRTARLVGNPFTPGSAASGDAGVLEEGYLTRGAISDLQRVEREMLSLQKIYNALHGQAVEQQTAIETIAGNLLSAEASSAQANKQLLVTQERAEYKLRWKIYFFLFVLVVFVVYALLS